MDVGPSKPFQVLREIRNVHNILTPDLFHVSTGFASSIVEDLEQKLHQALVVNCDELGRHLHPWPTPWENARQEPCSQHTLGHVMPCF